MSRRLTRFGLLGLAVAAMSFAAASPAVAKTKTATVNQCLPTFAVIGDSTATTTTAATAVLPVTVPKNKGKPQDGVVTAVNSVGVQVTHTFASDLVLILVSPSGRGVVLSRNNGGNDDGFGSAGCSGLVQFGDAFTTPITSAANPASSVLPVTGAFRPEQPLASLVGGPARGNWSLIAFDTVAGDIGAIGAVSLNFTYSYNAAKKKKKKKKK